MEDYEKMLRRGIQSLNKLVLLIASGWAIKRLFISFLIYFRSVVEMNSNCSVQFSKCIYIVIS